MTVFCSAQEFETLVKDLPDNVQRVRLQVKGGSMEPFIASGDWVTVSRGSVEKEEIKKGDIVLFKIAAALYLHRVLALKGDTVKTKGDASFGCDGIIEKADILGKVVNIEHNGRMTDLSTKRNLLYARAIADAGFILQYIYLFNRTIGRVLTALVDHLQSLRLYRKCVKVIVPAAVIVREAQPDDEESIRDLFFMGGHDVKKDIIDIKREGFWLVAVRKNKVVGALTVTRYEGDPNLWVIFGLEVKPLFRGLGIGRTLVEEAVLRVKSSSGREIGLFVNKKSRPALNLYSSLGFASTENFPKDFNRSPDELYLSHKFRDLS